MVYPVDKKEWTPIQSSMVSANVGGLLVTDAEFEYMFVDLYGSRIYERFLYNTKHVDGPGERVSAVAWKERIDMAFWWNESPEGMGFWERICEKEYVSLSDLEETQYVPPKCECGAIIARSPVHSDWCPLYKAEELI